jgi:hypothetical protein
MTAAPDHEAVLTWVLACAEPLARSRWAAALTCEAVIGGRTVTLDGYDALFAAVFSHALNVAQAGGAPPPVSPLRAAAAFLAETARHVRERAGFPRVHDLHPQPSSAGRVLMWPQNQTHFRRLVPVAHALDAHALDARFLLIVNREPFRAFVPAAWSADGRAVFTETALAARVREARQAGRSRAAVFDRAPGVALPAFPGLPGLAPERVLAFPLRAGLPHVHEAASVFAAVSLDGLPRAVVVGNDLTRDGRIAARLASAVGVPSFSVQHGSISGNPLHGHHAADRVLVFGENARQTLLGLGIAPERIAVTGDPADAAARHEDGAPPMRDILHALGLARPDQPVVLIATSGPGHLVSRAHHERIAAALVGLSQALPEAVFVAKLHPKDRIAYYPAEPARLHLIAPDDARFPPEVLYDLDRWLNTISCMITTGSTAALDAMRAGVPVVTLDLTGELGAIDFIAAGATTHVTDASALSDAVRTLITTPAAHTAARTRGDAFYARHAYTTTPGRPDGLAARRAADLIAAAASSRPP